MNKKEEKARSMIGSKIGDRTIVDLELKIRKYPTRIRSDWYYKTLCSNNHESFLKKSDLISSVCLKCYVPHNKKTHMRNTSIYNIWKAMRQRCMNKNSYDYKWYGGRGITICERWNVFSNFFDDMGHKPEGKSLDRIDNDKGYELDNCRWSTQKEQVNNSRRVNK